MTNDQKLEKFYKYGYMEFVDERGLTDKAMRARKITSQLVDIASKIEGELLQLDTKLIRNCTTVVSESRFKELEQIVEKTLKMWEDAQYPFNDQLLVRSSKFNLLSEFALPYETISIGSPAATADAIRKLLPQLDNPDQILLHPRLSIEELKKHMIAARFQYEAGKIMADIGIRGVDHAYDVEAADFVYEVNALDMSVTTIKGRLSKKHDEICKRLCLSAVLFSPVAESILVEGEKKEKTIVYEFRVLEKNGVYFMDFQDFEVV